ncbi:hypothetical protein EYF80_063043 [Liparis tanakae]|uniref:Uncharacterized protein n=1 Tax=Liparis tanakae TaxID=230148 RepID=A0A4Z2EE44_9TELE|nr:hypothetical protein EYF80_063043 [Liparis tanakae]
MDVPSQGVIHRACHLIGQCAHPLLHYDKHLFELLRHRGYRSSSGPVAGFAEVAPTPESTLFRTLLAEPLCSPLSAQAGSEESDPTASMRALVEVESTASQEEQLRLTGGASKDPASGGASKDPASGEGPVSYGIGDSGLFNRYLDAVGGGAWSR